MIEFPIKYFEGNLVFTPKNECWAFYSIKGLNYDFLSDDEKKIYFTRLKALFWQLELDTHMLVVPNFTTIEEKHQKLKERLKGPLKDAATRHAEDVAKRLKVILDQEGTEYLFIFGVKLPPVGEIKGKGFFKEIKESFNDFVYSIYSKTGLDFYDIPEEIILSYHKSEKRVFSKIIGRVKAEQLDETMIQWLIRRNWYRGIKHVPIWKDWSPTYIVSTEDTQVKARRPVTNEIIRLTEGLIDESRKRSLLIKQVINGEEKEGHVAFLTVSNVPYEMSFPDDEWIYMMQFLDFPLEMSIRTEPIENRKALSSIRNKQKELKDQDRHARETNNDTNLNILQGRQEAYELEAFLETSRMPLIKTSIVFVVSASDEEELRRRIEAVKDMYGDLMFQIEQPYGDQWLLFNECLIGSKRYVHDYIQYMEPATVASGMFSATRQLGDPEGFFIGTTGVLNQPVYIWPNRAAQGIHGTKTNALSACFLGSLGGGKSFSSNLITYLSVLSGAKGLVVDPKGERGGWKDALYELGSEINIITLSQNEEDKGKLDPFTIFEDKKEAEKLALDVLTFLTGVRIDDSERFPRLSQAVRKASESEFPSLSEVITILRLKTDDKVALSLGEHILSFKELSFAKLLFGDGKRKNTISLSSALNVLQIQNLELPAPDTPQEKYNLSEMLSVAMMLPISSFALKFIHTDRSQFKVVLLDEAWAVLNTSQGSHLAMKLVRAGRSMNAGIYFVTQNANDLLDEKMKNNIGMKFAFRSTDSKEIENVLELLNLKNTKYNAEILRELQNGQCLFQDIYGRCGVVKINALFKDLFDAFDTRPPEQVDVIRDEVMV
ncbi:MAG: ATP-binding protein [Bacillaceae bacterium]